MAERKLKFKPCPFCGSDEIQVLHYKGGCPDGPYDSYNICCMKCGGMTDFFNTPEKAQRRWNRRVGNG